MKHLQPEENQKDATGTVNCKILSALRRILLGAAVIAAVFSLGWFLTVFLVGSGFAGAGAGAGNSGAVIMDRYDTYINNSLADALSDLDGFARPKKNYWLSDDTLVAPEPKQNCFGETNDPATLGWLLEEAAELLGVTNTLFTTDTVIKPGSVVKYYLDETIFMVTWKQIVDDSVYAISEVKIAHASQFRRFMADGTYGSDKLYLTTEMAATVNAVVAASGDFYAFRGQGVIVNNRKVMRANPYIDVCYVDENGDLSFSRFGELKNVDEAQAYVDANKVRFSIAFGPVLVDNYQKAVPGYYQLGEPERRYSRAALAQMGERHYLLMTVNYDGCYQVPTIDMLANQMVKFGVWKAYALDGGQTATIVVNDELFNKPDYGAQRKISDIIYFATAIPENE